MAEERKTIAETVTREIVGGVGVGDIANAVVDTVRRISSSSSRGQGRSARH